MLNTYLLYPNSMSQGEFKIDTHHEKHVCDKLISSWKHQLYVNSRCWTTYQNQSYITNIQQYVFSPTYQLHYTSVNKCIWLLHICWIITIFAGEMKSLVAHIWQSACRVVCMLGLVCGLLCGFASCGWQEAKEVIALADSLDQAERVI